jgi:hypothetical protein
MQAALAGPIGLCADAPAELRNELSHREGAATITGIWPIGLTAEAVNKTRHPPSRPLRNRADGAVPAPTARRQFGLRDGRAALVAADRGVYPHHWQCTNVAAGVVVGVEGC